MNSYNFNIKTDPCITASLIAVPPSGLRLFNTGDSILFLTGWNPIPLKTAPTLTRSSMKD
jgi:hypothetical protein